MMRRLSKFSGFVILSIVFVLLLSGCGEADMAANAVEEPTADASPESEKFGSVIEQRLHNIQQQLTAGRLAYNPPGALSLAVGEETTLSAAILPLLSTAQDEAMADELLAEALDVEVEELERVTIKVSSTMHVELIGDTSAFKITPQFKDAEQALALDEPTEWSWLILPLKPGTHTLILSASAIVDVAGEKESRTKTYEKEITTTIFSEITVAYLLNKYFVPLLVAGILVGGATIYFTTQRILFRQKKRALMADLATQSPEQGKGYIFVSYAHANEKFVIPLARDLMKNGVRVWLDQREIKAGEDWMNEIEVGLAETDALMLILSPKSVASKYVMMEVDAALQTGKKVFPVMYQMCELPETLSKLHFVDFQHDYPTALETLLDNLTETGFKK